MVSSAIVTDRSTPAQERVNLLGLSPDNLTTYFEQLGEKRFRAQQVLQWIHQRRELDFVAMHDLSKTLRQKLIEQAELVLPEVVSTHKSEDGTRKWLIRMDGGSCVETVFIPERERGTLCVSSQIGCSLDCSFCATGKQGFNRDLSSAEIIAQLWIAEAALQAEYGPRDRYVTNVVLMGMGEPLLNFDNVVSATQLMLSDYAYGLSKRRVTLSTSGVVPDLDRLAKVSDVSLAISLHAPNDNLRNELVPINKKYPIAELLASVERYFAALPDKRRKVTIEYTLIKNINDSDELAYELVELLKDTPCKINLIPFNPFVGSSYEKVSNNRLRAFQAILMNAGYTVTIRTTRGDDIAAACGQLAGSVNDKTKRSSRAQPYWQPVNNPDQVHAVRAQNDIR